MRQWITLCEKQQKLYFRFGEIPENERSGIGHRPWHMSYKEEEDGVSCYWTHWDEAREQWVLDDVGNIASVDELIYLGSEGKRNMYVLTGDEQEELGTDNEPLLRNIKVVQKIENVKSIFVPGVFDGKHVEPTRVFNFKGLYLVRWDGSIHREDEGRISEPDLDNMMGNFSSFNGIKGTFEGKPAICFREMMHDTQEHPVNKVAMKVAHENFGFEEFHILKGGFLVLIEPSQQEVYESLEEVYRGKPFNPRTTKIIDGLMAARFDRRRDDMRVVREAGGNKIWRGDGVIYLTDADDNPMAYIVGTDTPGCFAVHVSFVGIEFLGKGYGQLLYDYLLDEGLMIVSDNEHSKKAEKLWARLVADPRNVAMIKHDDNKMEKLDRLSKAYWKSAVHSRIVIKRI